MKKIIDINDRTANCQISIKLDDDCRNGHEDFSITATFWDIGKPRTDKYNYLGGCCHDEILKLRPDLAKYVDMHLCDFKGAPMYAVSNGFYHLKHSGPDSCREYLRLTDSEIKVLATAGDETHFHYLLQTLGVPERWKVEADKIIFHLEQMTGEKFTSRATKSHFAPMSAEDVADVEQKIADGYYTPEQIAFRAECKTGREDGKLHGHHQSKSSRRKT